MRKGRCLLPVLAAVTVLASCGRTAETPGEAVLSSESADEAGSLPATEMDESRGLLEESRQAFGKALWDVYLRGILPDGEKLEYVDREAAEGNSFYENGMVEIGWSHNQGLSSSFWPYFVYAYDAGSDTWRSVGGADAWEKSVWEEDYSGNPFPEETDTDGDGMVYFILPADWDGRYEGIRPVDGEEYEEWRNSWLDGAAKMDISFQKLTEENIAALGYPKPDYPDLQPLG